MRRPTTSNNFICFKRTDRELGVLSIVSNVAPFTASTRNWCDNTSRKIECWDTSDDGSNCCHHYCGHAHSRSSKRIWNWIEEKWSILLGLSKWTYDSRLVIVILFLMILTRQLLPFGELLVLLKNQSIQSKINQIYNKKTNKFLIWIWHCVLLYM